MGAQNRDLEADEVASKGKDSQDHVIRPRRSQTSQSLCFTCKDENVTSPLKEVMAMEVNERLNKCARDLGHTTLLTRLTPSKVAAQEFKYHVTCLI